MKIGARQRWMALIALLTLTLSAAAWVREADRKRDAEVVEAPARPRPPRAARAPESQAPERVRLEKLRGRDPGSGADDPFAPRTWRKPPPKPAMAAVPAPQSVAPPPPPSAPPLPFTYLGRLLSEDASEVFLALGERNLIVHEGEIIESTYRVDKVSEAKLTFTHLPSGVEQHLAIGAPQ